MTIDLEQRRHQLEREARDHALEVRLWLTLASIAVPAVLRAAAGGNVTCREAARSMAPLLRRTNRGSAFVPSGVKSALAGVTGSPSAPGMCPEPPAPLSPEGKR